MGPAAEHIVMRPALATCMVLLAGCSNSPSPDLPSASVLEGFVLDEALRPIDGARVDAHALDLSATVDDQGHFLLDVATRDAVTLTASAAGFQSESLAASVAGGVVTFQLDRVSGVVPRVVVESYNGYLQCAVVVIEEGGDPQHHRGVRCSDVMEDDRRRWGVHLPVNVTAVVVELDWDHASSWSNTLMMSATIGGEPVGFAEGLSVLRMQIAQESLRRAAAAGETEMLVVVDAGAGDTEQEEGSVGIFTDQAFTLYATHFINQPADPGYSIEGGR